MRFMYPSWTWFFIGLIMMVPLLAMTVEESLEQQGFVDINAADAATLAQWLHGVGPAKAAAIVAYRETYGPIVSIEELIEVPGIGHKTIDRNRDRVIVRPLGNAVSSHKTKSVSVNRLGNCSRGLH